jgi:hypothetical protein
LWWAKTLQNVQLQHQQRRWYGMRLCLFEWMACMADTNAQQIQMLRVAVLTLSCAL